MAPDVACAALDHLRRGSLVIDPMCGSGSVLRACVEKGLLCAGIDIDPLAVLMARVWTTRIDPQLLEDQALLAVEEARGAAASELALPTDTESRAFLEYWFAEEQREQLAAIAGALRREPRAAIRDALSIAFSRLIITKDSGASLARDVSHSRPHRVALQNDFDVYSSFPLSARQVGQRLAPKRIKATAAVAIGDSRDLSDLAEGTFDAAVTSPPYLNAIDYMRGHRMTLMWLGYDVKSLRAIRSASIGAERTLSEIDGEVEAFIARSPSSTFGDVHAGWVRRYARDLGRALAELDRVVKGGGRITLVVGNSVIRGAIVDNAALIEHLAESVGLRRIGRRDRAIPARRRYLPPPGSGDKSLDSRMRKETVLTFECD